MPPDGFKTQVLLLHNDQSALDKLGAEFDLRYTVHTATSGSQALKALAEAPIDIFVSASDLPGMSGLEALREAKMRSPQTLGILLSSATADKGAATVGDEVFQIVRGDVTGEALFELVENAARQMHLPVLSRSANDTTAHVDHEPEHIVMETADDGSAIVSQTSARLRSLNPQTLAAILPVHVLVLTKDTEFLETIRSSSNNLHKVHSAVALPEAEDIIRNHEVGVAIIDAAIVRDKIEGLTQHLRREAPRLVSIVAGRRDDGEMLIDLVNRGNVYRFLLKPVSTGRARLAVAASVKHHLESPDTAFTGKDNADEPLPAAPESASNAADAPKEIATESAADVPADNGVAGKPGEETHEPDTPNNSAATESLSKTGAFRMVELAAAATQAARPTHRFGKMPLVGAVAAVLAMIAIGVFFLTGDSEDIVEPQNNVEPQTAAEPATVTPVVTEVTEVAQVTPVTEITEDTEDTEITEIDVPFIPRAVDRLINMAETALLNSRLPDADDALQRVTALDPANARLPFLTAQLAQARLRLRLNEARTAIRESRFEDATDALSAAEPLAAVSGSAEFETLAAELSSARSKQQTDAVLALANASLESGALLSPPNGNARYYYELVLSNDPENAAARQGLSLVANRVVLQARAEVDNGNFDVAQELLYNARTLDSNNSELLTTASALQVARESAAAALAVTDVTEAYEENEAPLATATAAAEEAVDIEPPAAVSSLLRTKYVAPKYPRNALRRNLSGWVDVEFTVAVDGTVKDAAVRASEPGDVFVDAATHAVEQWEFEPVSSDGVLVERRAAVRMMFSLD